MGVVISIIKIADNIKVYVLKNSIKVYVSTAFRYTNSAMVAGTPSA